MFEYLFDFRDERLIIGGGRGREGGRKDGGMGGKGMEEVGEEERVERREWG